MACTSGQVTATPVLRRLRRRYVLLTMDDDPQMGGLPSSAQNREVLLLSMIPGVTESLHFFKSVTVCFWGHATRDSLTEPFFSLFKNYSHNILMFFSGAVYLSRDHGTRPGLFFQETFGGGYCPEKWGKKKKKKRKRTEPNDEPVSSHLLRVL